MPGPLTEGTIKFPPTTAAGASIRLPHGTAPSSPVDGDVWTTTAGVFARRNGATKQLDGTVAFADLPSGSGSWDVGVGNTLTFPRATAFSSAVTMGSSLGVTGDVTAAGVNASALSAFAAGVSITGGANGAGRIVKTAGNGMSIIAATGSSYDFILIAANAGDGAMAMPAGTKNLEFYGTLKATGLPTSNPGGSGNLWNDGGTLKIT